MQFGILSEEETQFTAVGWGPLAEGYANFGFLGVAIAAVVIGLLGGALTSWSAGAPAVSLPALFPVAAMLQMANMEADLAYLFTSLLQSFAGVVDLLRRIPLPRAAGTPARGPRDLPDSLVLTARPGLTPAVSAISSLQIVASINPRTGGPAASVTGLAMALDRHGIRTSIVSLDYAEHGAPIETPGVASIRVGAVDARQASARMVARARRRDRPGGGGKQCKHHPSSRAVDVPGHL